MGRASVQDLLRRMLLWDLQPVTGSSEKLYTSFNVEGVFSSEIRNAVYQTHSPSVLSKEIYRLTKKAELSNIKNLGKCTLLSVNCIKSV